MLLSMVSVLLEGLSRAYSCNPAPRRDRGALYGLRNSAGEGGGVGEWGSGGVFGGIPGIAGSALSRQRWLG